MGYTADTPVTIISHIITFAQASRATLDEALKSPDIGILDVTMYNFRAVFFVFRHCGIIHNYRRPVAICYIQTDNDSRSRHGLCSCTWKIRHGASY